MSTPANWKRFCMVWVVAASDSTADVAIKAPDQIPTRALPRSIQDFSAETKETPHLHISSPCVF